MKLENFKNGYDVTVGSSLAVNEKNDCAVRAFANAFSITYNAAHKFAEEAMYKCIAYAILSTRQNVPEYVVRRYKKERFAETRKAKLRLSNIKLEEITQIFRGKSKQIKH